ncbi:MAG: hypothetical protein M3A44_05210 [Gammaproteobacteria bacterium]
MWPFRCVIQCILLTIVGLGVFCANCAMADEVAGMMPVKPTIGSFNCSNVTYDVPSCPHMPVPSYNREVAAPPSVNPWAAARMFVTKYWMRRDSFDFANFNPNQINTSQHGFTVNMTLAYPGASMNMDMRDLNVKWSAMGGTVKPFSSNNPYAVVQFSYRW